MALSGRQQGQIRKTGQTGQEESPGRQCRKTGQEDRAVLAPEGEVVGGGTGAPGAGRWGGEAGGGVGQGGAFHQLRVLLGQLQGPGGRA